MGYRIDYSKSGNREFILNNTNKSNKFVSGVLVACAICISLFILLGNEKNVENIFIPGNPGETKAAFSSFTDNLEKGMSFRESFADFCLEIIENAEK